MYTSYNKLWKLLIDKGWKKKDLQRAAGLSSSSIAKLSKNENVQMDVLVRICSSLNCDISDIVEILPIEPSKTINGHRVRFIDLFAGIGGFRQAFDACGCQCVFSSEIDPACQKVYCDNYGDIPSGDITKIDAKDIPDFDVLCAGFPCQPFSICGRKKGFEDTRGTLFFEICRIIKEKQPRVVFLENVKHLINHDKGRTFAVIIATLEELGYNVSYKLLNSKDFGVAQSRERIIIIGVKDRIFDFNKLPAYPQIKIYDILDKTGDFEYLSRDEYTMIDSKYVHQQESGLIFVGYRNKGTWKKGVRPNSEHLSRVHRQPNRIYSTDGLHPTIPSQETSGRFWIYIPQEDAVRKLTINECYKLMGYPSSFKKDTNIGNAYKQIGNSVVIPMVSEIAKSIMKQIFKEEKSDDTRANHQQLKIDF